MGNQAYTAYIASPEWKAKRAQVLKRAGGWCEKCGKYKATQVHHKTYRNLFRESLTDLLAVCYGCHQKEHPDKMDPGGRAIFATDVECPVCPSTTADLYIAGPWKMFVCHGCGETTKQRRTPTKKGRPQRPQVPCPCCGERIRSHVGLYLHMRAEHPTEAVPLRTVRKYERRKAKRMRRKEWAVMP